MPLVSGSRGKGNDADQVIDYAVSFNHLAQFNETPKASRPKLAAHIGAAPEEVALVRTTDSTSEGGDEIVIWEQNQVTNNEAWDIWAKRFGQKIVRVAVPPVQDSDEQVMELLAKACSEHTKVLTFTEVSNVTGCTLLARRCIKADLQGRRQLHQANAESRGTLPVGVSMGLTHT